MEGAGQMHHGKRVELSQAPRCQLGPFHPSPLPSCPWWLSNSLGEVNAPHLGEVGGLGAKWGLKRPLVCPASFSPISSGTTALNFGLQLHTLVWEESMNEINQKAQYLLAITVIVISSLLLLWRRNSHMAVGENVNHSSLSEWQ